MWKARTVTLVTSGFWSLIPRHQQHQKQHQWKRPWPRATDLQAHFWWIGIVDLSLKRYVQQKRIGWTVKHIFKCISSRGQQAQFTTFYNYRQKCWFKLIADLKFSFLWFRLAGCRIVWFLCWIHILRPAKVPHVAVRGHLDGSLLPTSSSGPSGILPAWHGVRWPLGSTF